MRSSLHIATAAVLTLTISAETAS